MTDAERDELRRSEGTMIHLNRLHLADLAARVAAGIEAHPQTNDWTPEQIAGRAVAVARAIVAEVNKP